MAAGLKLVLNNQIFQLAFKVFISGLALLWSPWAFLVAALWLYFRPLLNAFTFFYSFAVFLFLALWMAGADIFLLRIFLAAFFSFLFFIILGVKNMVLVNRKKWHAILIISLIYLLLISYFIVDKSQWFFLSWLLFAGLIFILVRELFTAVLPPVFILVVVFIISQLLWVVNWLPIGFLNSSNLVILSILLLLDLLANYHQKNINRRLLIKDIGVFLFLLAIIFLTSSWTL